jgi:hypothetical protein
LRTIVASSWSEGGTARVMVAKFWIMRMDLPIGGKRERLHSRPTKMLHLQKDSKMVCFGW